MLEIARTMPIGKNSAACNAVVREAFSKIHCERTAMQQVPQLSAVVDRASADKELRARPEELSALAASAHASATALQDSAATARAAAARAEADAAALLASAEDMAAQSAAVARAEAIRASIPEERAPLAIEAAEAQARGTATVEQRDLASQVAKEAPAAEAAASRAHSATRAKVQRSAESKTRESKSLAQTAVEKEDQGAQIMTLAQKPEVLAKVVEQAVQKKRGRDEEDDVLEDAARRHQMAIHARNERKAQLEERDFTIIGICDGIMANGSIVEVKKRRNWFNKPPEYDIVQLRVYLRLYGLRRGLLIEEQLNGDKRRETAVEDCPAEWESICQALSQCATELREAKVHTICAWSEAFLKQAN